jgi:glycerol-3-phosphate acyltransferase PlsY
MVLEFLAVIGISYLVGSIPSGKYCWAMTPSGWSWG